MREPFLDELPIIDSAADAAPKPGSRRKQRSKAAKGKSKRTSARKSVRPHLPRVPGGKAQARLHFFERQRQIDQTTVVDRCNRLRRSRIHERCGRRHLNGLTDLAQLHCQVGTHVGVDAEHHVGRFGALEARRLRLDNIGAGYKTQDLIEPGIVSRARASRAGLAISKRDLGPADHRASRVLNVSTDVAIGLSPEGQ